jgi:hypothetical protein
MRDIERLAREAGFRTGQINLMVGCDAIPFIAPISATSCIVELERFAALVRNEVLEEAANTAYELDAPFSCSMVEKSLWDVATTSAGDAIRALKDKK